jgi:TrmH family RNA methyltransferase
MPTITSIQNARIKQIRALRQRKERERSGLFFVEGPHSIAAAIKAHAAIELLVRAPTLLTDSFAVGLAAQLERSGTLTIDVSSEVFETLAAKESGIGAVVRQRWRQLAKMTPQQGRCWVALDSVQYPGNLGTILRTSDAIGGAGAILLGSSTDPYDPAAVRASVGAIFTQQLVRSNAAELSAWKHHHQIYVVGTSPVAQLDYRAASYDAPVVVLMGCERSGLPSNLQALCDAMVQIPMVGRSDSLNLAVATSLVLYEVFRQQHPLSQAS